MSLLNWLPLHYWWGEPAAIYHPPLRSKGNTEPRRPPAPKYKQACKPPPLTLHVGRAVCLTCGGPDGPDENGGHRHDQAAESSQKWEDLGVRGRGGRQDSLEVHLPGDPSQHLQHRRRKNTQHWSHNLVVQFLIKGRRQILKFTCQTTVASVLINKGERLLFS